MGPRAAQRAGRSPGGLSNGAATPSTRFQGASSPVGGSSDGDAADRDRRSASARGAFCIIPEDESRSAVSAGSTSPPVSLPSLRRCASSRRRARVSSFGASCAKSGCPRRDASAPRWVAGAAGRRRAGGGAADAFASGRAVGGRAGAPLACQWPNVRANRLPVMTVPLARGFTYIIGRRWGFRRWLT